MKLMINLKLLEKSALTVKIISKDLKDSAKKAEINKVSSELLKLASRTDLVILVFDKKKTN